MGLLPWSAVGGVGCSMSSDSNDKTGKKPATDRKGRVVTNERGHQMWEGTIRTLKISLMKTGLFYRSEDQKKLIELRAKDPDDAGVDFDDELEISDEGEGFNPYDSGKKP